MRSPATVSIGSNRESLPNRAISPVTLSCVLFLATLSVYLPALNNGFVNYDDPAYVTSNAHVLRGLTWSNVRWAFTATVEANWHPLAWISHMADVQMFGMNPRGHHAVSIVLHAVNVVLLFLLLRRATEFLMRSALVAALFAVHPLNVECVAWVAERKSLLSMLFLLLTLLAYGWYAGKRSVGRYCVVVALFALGLAAKPMIVTLPVLLLLWDYWPLGRIQQEKPLASLLRLAAEKIPLLALSAASSWVTIYAQRAGGALGNADLLPLGQRVANAIVSYAAYLGKGIWPTGLAVFYPHPEHSLEVWKVLGAGLLLLAITALVWLLQRGPSLVSVFYQKAESQAKQEVLLARAQRAFTVLVWLTRRRPYLLTGWLWYLAAMLPMIGIIQVGRQAMADRYAYLPFVGLFMIAVWVGAELCVSLELSRAAQAAIAAGAFVAYVSVAFLQINYWRNSLTLFSHALAVTEHNGIAEDNLGVALMEAGRPDLAAGHFEAAAAYIPQLATAHYNLGVLAQRAGQADAAVREYDLALRFSSDVNDAAQAHSNLGFVLLDANRQSEAITQFSAALAINPEKQNSLLGRGIAEYRSENLDAAIADLSHAAAVAPMAQTDYWLGRAFEDKGNVQGAVQAYRAALQLAPEMTEARDRLAALQR